MTKTRKQILYSSYFIAASAFFLYVLFPSDAVKQYVASAIVRANPNFSVTMDRVKPALPPGLKFYSVSLFHGNQLWVAADHVKASPKLWSLFTQKPVFFFTASGCEGRVSGRVETAKNTSDRRIRLEANLSGIQIGKISGLQNPSLYRLSGLLNGKFSYSDNQGSAEKMTAALNLSDLKIEPAQPVLILNQFAFKQVQADLEMNGQTLQIKQCVLKGDQANGKVSGQVMLKEPLGKSVLNLTGSLKPNASFLESLGNGFPINLLFGKKSGESGLSFKITGTWERPGFSIN